MNDFTELEAKLKQLRPSAPTADLMMRVEQALAQVAGATPSGGVLPRQRMARVNWLALGFGLTAAAAFLFLARVDLERSHAKPSKLALATPPRVIAPAADQGLLPDGVTRVVYGRTDEGLLFPRNAQQPVRRVRSISRETVRWKNPNTGASLRVSYPTDEVELIPVAGQ